MQIGKSSAKVSIDVGAKDKDDSPNSVHGYIYMDVQEGGINISLTEVITILTTRWDLFVKLVKGIFTIMPEIRNEIRYWYNLRRELRMAEIRLQYELDNAKYEFPSEYYHPSEPKPKTSTDKTKTSKENK